MTRYWPHIVGLMCLLASVPGCATFWDEALSTERDWAYATGIGKPDPLIVIRNNADGMPNADGLRRSQAFAELREPATHGGNAKDQETYLKLLHIAATTDTEPICRLTAIRALGKYRDPQAARILEEVYQLPVRKPKMAGEKVLPFTNEFNSTIRKEAIVALETTRDQEARRFLINVARQPGPPAEADLEDRKQTQDERLVAVRALGKYRDPECVNALFYVMKTEKDIALRDCALQSLHESTGKRWPASYDAWQRENVQPIPTDGSNGFIQRVGGWFTK
ncbi:MAG: hypothetical protein FJ303_07000 [Planctomycetes bacterium]|nr:hypothetical protein [Planctomycetota bacterium]